MSDVRFARGRNPVVSPVYDRDVYGWANRQAELIRAGRFGELDLANVAEEIASVGKSQRDAFESNLARVIQHLLKWDFQPGKSSASWWHSVNSHRVRASKLLRKNPSFRSELGDLLGDAFDIAVADAMADTELPRSAFPAVCPYSFTEVIERVLEPISPDPSR